MALNFIRPNSLNPKAWNHIRKIASSGMVIYCGTQRGLELLAELLSSKSAIRSALDHLTTAKDEPDFKKYANFVLQHSDLVLDSVSTMREAVFSLAVQGGLVPRDTNKSIQELTMEDLVGKKNLKNGLSLTQSPEAAKFSCLPISAMRDGLISCSDRKA